MYIGLNDLTAYFKANQICLASKQKNLLVFN